MPRPWTGEMCDPVTPSVLAGSSQLSALMKPQDKGSWWKSWRKGPTLCLTLQHLHSWKCSRPGSVVLGRGRGWIPVLDLRKRGRSCSRHRSGHYRDSSGHCRDMDSSGHYMDSSGYCRDRDSSGHCRDIGTSGHCRDMESSGHCRDMDSSGHCRNSRDGNGFPAPGAVGIWQCWPKDLTMWTQGLGSSSQRFSLAGNTDY